MSQLKEIHKFLMDLVVILNNKEKAQQNDKKLPKEMKEYTSGQLYEAGFILSVVEEIIYNNKKYVNS